MAVTHTLQATFTQSIGKAIALPAGAKTMVFFGTGGDGIETNRVAGGPALTVTSGVPVHATTYVSLGQQAGGTRYDVIDSGVAADTTNFPLGYTWACVARTQAASIAQCMGNKTAASGQGLWPDYLGLQGGTNRVINGGAQANRGQIQLTQSVATAWHFIAQTYTGGASGTVTTYEFTENQAGQLVTYAATTKAASSAVTTHFGSLSVEDASTLGPIDTAWGYVGTGVVSQANLAALAASIRPWLARRGIVC